MDPLFRSPWPAARRQVSPLAFCSVDLGQAVGFVDARWPDLAWLPLGDGGRRWRVRIWELEELVRGQARFWARASRSTAQSPQIRRPQNTRYILSIMILGL